ncbi:MAG: SIMPL domain-containing protein [Aquabacterium sp.]
MPALSLHLPTATPWVLPPSRFLAAVLGAFVLNASAQTQPEPPRNAVRFAATATEEVTQDLLTITLQAFREGSQAGEVQAQLKQVLESALTEARKSAQPNGMEVRTGGFSVQPRYNNSGRITGWQGSAQLILEGTDVARIAQTSGRLNQLNVINVGYGLSRQLRERRESELTTQAIERFKTRATQIASDFGMKGYALAEVSVSSTDPGFVPRPYMAMAARAKTMEAADAPLPLEPGKGVLQVTVEGQVVLKP